MSEIGSALKSAFPASLERDVEVASGALTEGKYMTFSPDTFAVMWEGSQLQIPERFYGDINLAEYERLTALQRDIVDCFMTRHANGYRREAALRRLLAANHAWAAPFVFRLVGEYVVEILEVIRDNLDGFDCETYVRFAWENQPFVQRIERRAISYWNCYYRGWGCYRTGQYLRYPDYPSAQILNWLAGPTLRASHSKRF